MQLFSLNDGNQEEQIYFAESDYIDLKSLEETYDWAKFDEHDNMFFELVDLISENSPEVEFRDGENIDTYWLKMNRKQKAVWLFGIFNSHVFNGSINLFLFKYPDFSVAMLEVLEELGLENVLADYLRVFSDFVKKEALGKEIATHYKKLSAANDIDLLVNKYTHLALDAELDYFEEAVKKDIYRRLYEYMVEHFRYFAQ